MSSREEPLVVRDAAVADTPSSATIGRVPFPAVHDEVVGAAVSAAVVEQIYSIEALTDCITRCAGAEDAAFIVAERDGVVVGYLHYDSGGRRTRAASHLCRSRPEARRHRQRADAGGARATPFGKLVRLSRRRGQHRRAGVLRTPRLVVERRVDGNTHSSDAMDIDLGAPPQAARVF